MEQAVKKLKIDCIFLLLIILLRNELACHFTLPNNSLLPSTSVSSTVTQLNSNTSDYFNIFKLQKYISTNGTNIMDFSHSSVAESIIPSLQKLLELSKKDSKNKKKLRLRLENLKFSYNLNFVKMKLRSFLQRLFGGNNFKKIIDSISTKENILLKNLSNRKLFERKMNPFLSWKTPHGSVVGEIKKFSLSQNKYLAKKHLMKDLFNKLKKVSINIEGFTSKSAMKKKNLNRVPRSNSANVYYVQKSENQKLQSVQCHIITIYRLKTADCSNRRLNEIPSNLGEDLKVLNLSTNFINNFKPEHFANYKHIQEIILSNNNLQVLTPFTFSHLKLLHLLELEKNNLRIIPARAFYNCLSLKILSLKDNPLEWIDDQAFEGLKNLEVLNLENCFLKVFDLFMLKNMMKLQELNVANNRLTTLHEIKLEYIPASLIVFRFSGNQWNCDCNLTWLRKFFENSHINWDFPKNRPLCVFPEILYGMSWSQLHSHQFACPPVILTNLSSQSVIQSKINEIVEIKCIFSGDPTPRVNWLASYDGKNFHPYVLLNKANGSYQALNKTFIPELNKKTIIAGLGNNYEHKMSIFYMKYRYKKETQHQTKNDPFAIIKNVKDMKKFHNSHVNSFFSKPVLIDSIFVKIDGSEKRKDFKCVVENKAGRSEMAFKIIMIKQKQFFLHKSSEAIFGMIVGCILVILIMFLIANKMVKKMKQCSKNVIKADDQNGFVLKNELDLMVDGDEKKKKHSDQSKNSKHFSKTSKIIKEKKWSNFKLPSMKRTPKALDQESYFVFTSLDKMHKNTNSTSAAFSSFPTTSLSTSNNTILNKYIKTNEKPNFVNVNFNKNQMNYQQKQKILKNSTSLEENQYCPAFSHLTQRDRRSHRQSSSLMHAPSTLQLVHDSKNSNTRTFRDCGMIHDGMTQKTCIEPVTWCNVLPTGSMNLNTSQSLKKDQSFLKNNAERIDLFGKNFLSESVSNNNERKFVNLLSKSFCKNNQDFSSQYKLSQHTIENYKNNCENLNLMELKNPKNIMGSEKEVCIEALNKNIDNFDIIIENSKHARACGKALSRTMEKKTQRQDACMGRRRSFEIAMNQNFKVQNNNERINIIENNRQNLDNLKTKTLNYQSSETNKSIKKI